MADPVRGNLIEEMRRHKLHSRDIDATLQFLRDTLGRENISFGVIGAIAVQHYGFYRFTEDIDILTTREGLDRIHETVIGLGLLPRAAGLRKKLRQTQFKVNVDIVTAGEHAGADTSPIVFPSPESDAFVLVKEAGLRIVTLEKLIELKIASGIWGKRGQDLVDVQKLIQVNGLAESFAEKLPAGLRTNYLELLRGAREERELAE